MSTIYATPTSATVEVPGATLYYEVRGTGPLLVMLGTPSGTGPFAELADMLADKHTVVTYDPRGTGRSTVHHDRYDDTPELRADDVCCLLDALESEPVEMFGTSGGAMTGLALLTRVPARVRTLVAHEPPVTALLPEATQLRIDIDDVVATFHAHGADAAWRTFLTVAGFDAPPEPDGLGDEGEALTEPDPDGDYFLSRMLPHTPGYQPDLAALAAARTRIIVGGGDTSRGQLAHRCAGALAAALATPLVGFPGDHLGFLAHPEQFAARLHQELAHR